MNRNDLHILARTRLREARALIQDNKPRGAYYLAGYAVECGLKACIARKTNRHDFPDKDLALDSFTHSIEKLVRVAGLQATLEAKQRASHDFEINWSIVLNWSEKSRYNTIISIIEARALYSAITARTHGVMTWIRTQW